MGEAKQNAPSFVSKKNDFVAAVDTNKLSCKLTDQTAVFRKSSN